MLSKVKGMLTDTAWFAVGVTAIAVEKSCEVVKDIASEVKDGAPQEYAKWVYRDTKYKCRKIHAKYHCPDNEPLHFHHDGCPACDG